MLQSLQAISLKNSLLANQQDSGMILLLPTVSFFFSTEFKIFFSISSHHLQDKQNQCPAGCTIQIASDKIKVRNLSLCT